MVSFEIEVFHKSFWKSQQDLISIISVIDLGATAHVFRPSEALESTSRKKLFRAKSTILS